ncbi:MAG TPA: hypothetical protein VMS86_00730 [Thermoanaerobaculia bacterium]|nr:hypothetical protein [Thermoanaerobaculia bacterium]
MTAAAGRGRSRAPDRPQPGVAPGRPPASSLPITAALDWQAALPRA